MKNHVINTVGEAVTQQYRGFHLAIGGIIAESMRGTAPTSQSARAGYIANLQQFEATTLTTIGYLIDSGMRDVIDLAIGREEVYGIDAAGARDAALGSIAAALHKDSMVAAKRIRDFSLRVELLLNSTRQTYQAALTSASIVENRRPLVFSQIDASGRRWQPSLYAAATVKAALQTSYADAFVRAASARGDTSVRVIYPDPSHDDHGVLLSIADDYLAVRDALFHPNSTAMLAREE